MSASKPTSVGLNWRFFLCVFCFVFMKKPEIDRFFFAFSCAVVG